MEKPIHISERLELFVDRFLINTMDKIEFQLHEPQRLALPKTPFRGAYMTVIKDGDIYRGYYRGDDPAYPGPRNYSGHPGEITCYAESRNGHEWTFPSIGLFDVNGTRSNNVILAKQPPLSHGGSGENPEEIHTMADTLLKGVVDLATITGHGRNGLEAWMEFDSPVAIIKADFTTVSSI
jgi:hypothetical protein